MDSCLARLPAKQKQTNKKSAEASTNKNFLKTISKHLTQGLHSIITPITAHI